MIHIGIDPGTKTGIAVWDSATKQFIVVGTCSIVEAIFLVREYPEADTKIHYEDARQRSWFGSKGREVMKGVGSVERDCKIWEQFCAHFGYESRAVHPKNIVTKLDAKRFEAMTGYTGRTSEHARDAAMIVWGIG